MWRQWRAVRDASGVELRPEIHFLGFGPGVELLPGSHRVVDFTAC
jgi:hypothetical protein